MESITPTRIDIKSSFINLIIHYFTQIFHSTFFFLPLRAYRLGYFEFKTLFLLRSYYKNAYRRESGGKSWSSHESLPRTTKANLALLLSANHWRQYWTPKYPEVQLAVELDSRVRTLHEQDPGERTWAPRQHEGVQSGHWHCRYQLDGDTLACAEIAEAAHHKSSSQFHVS